MGTQSHGWNDIGFKVLVLAWSDAEFKRALLDDPHAALRKYFDYDVPADVALVVSEGVAKAQDSLHLVIPPRPMDLMDGRVETSLNPETLQAKPCFCCIC